jgi:hypothetical protein
MIDAAQLAQQFLDALSSNDAARYEAVLDEDAGLRLNRWDGREVSRPRSAAWAGWQVACWSTRGAA